MRLFNPELIGTSCRAFGKLESIEKHDVFEVCYYLDFLKVSNNGNYSFSVSEENTELLNTMRDCNLQYGYTFSGGQLPNIGDIIYFTSEYGYNRITGFGKDVYDGNSNYIDCLQYVDAPDGSYNDPLTYKIITPCKVSGKIEDITRTFTDTCGLNLGIKVKDGENTYIVGGREYFSGKDISLCLGVGEGWFQIDISDGKITTNVNVGDNFYAVLNQKDNTILRYGQNEYNNADSSIPICNSATNEQIQAFTGGITGEQLKLIMNTVEKQILNDFPDLKYKQEKTIESSGAIVNSTGDTINNNKILSIKSNNKTNYTQKKLSTSTINEIKEIKPLSKNQTKENISDFSGTIEQSKINTGEIQKNIKETKQETQLIEPRKQEENGGINYSIIGIILIIFIVFVYIVRKNKKQD